MLLLNSLFTEFLREQKITIPMYLGKYEDNNRYTPNNLGNCLVISTPCMSNIKTFYGTKLRPTLNKAEREFLMADIIKPFILRQITSIEVLYLENQHPKKLDTIAMTQEHLESIMHSNVELSSPSDTELHCKLTDDYNKTVVNLSVNYRETTEDFYMKVGVNNIDAIDSIMYGYEQVFINDNMDISKILPRLVKTLADILNHNDYISSCRESVNPPCKISL